MYQHLRIAMEQNGERLKYKQEQSNIRRRRTIIDTCQPPTIVSHPATIYDNKTKELNYDLEMLHQQLIDSDGASDTDTDFDLSSSDDKPIESQYAFDSCNGLPNDEDESFLLDDLFITDQNQNSSFLRLYTTMKKHDFCRKLVEIFRDVNISNIHCSSILKYFHSQITHYHH